MRASEPQHFVPMNPAALANPPGAAPHKSRWLPVPGTERSPVWNVARLLEYQWRIGTAAGPFMGPKAGVAADRHIGGSQPLARSADRRAGDGYGWQLHSRQE